MASKPCVFNIPASTPFLPTLIKALADGRMVSGFPATRDPLAFATATLYLPTRRACRLARDIFLDAIGKDAAILPRIVPIGDVDEDEIVFLRWRAERWQPPRLNCRMRSVGSSAGSCWPSWCCNGRTRRRCAARRRLVRCA
jgi:hypothetical protein